MPAGERQRAGARRLGMRACMHVGDEQETCEDEAGGARRGRARAGNRSGAGRGGARGHAQTGLLVARRRSGDARRSRRRRRGRVDAERAQAPGQL
jgi:hypothetical protein